MKFIFATVVSALFASCTLAQSIAIGAPDNMASVNAGSSLIVEVDRPNTLSGSVEVAIVIALNPCDNTTCVSPPDEALGTILYNGPYSPQLNTSAGHEKPPHQNFTVTIPSTFAKGIAQLDVFHVTLIGAGPNPFSETKNLTLNIL